MKNKVKARAHDRGGQTNAGDLKIGDRIIVKPDQVKTIGWALIMGGETDPINATVTALYADNTYAVQPDGTDISYYVIGEAVELSGEPRRCSRPDCSEDAVNGLCESHESQQAENAATQRSQVSERIKQGEQVRSNAASKAWETRRRREDEKED